jgi:glycosyltransferase involved in cell wall biosynthesis
MTGRRRILMLTYLPPAVGGIATWAGIVRRLSRGGRFSFLFLDVAGLRGGRRAALFKVLSAALLLARLVKHLCVSRPDVVHINCCLSAAGLWRFLLAARLASAWRVPVLVHYHGSLPDAAARLPAHSNYALKKLVRSADANVGITRASVSLLDVLCNGRKAYYLPNFIEDAWVDPPATACAETAADARGEKLRAIYVGRLSRDKGTLDLIRAARELPGVEFVMVGEITESVRGALKTAPPNVAVTGVLPRTEVMELLRRSDLLVFPSHREGFPNSVLEAMATGLPAVCTQVGGIKEMIEVGKGGLLTPPSDVPALVGSIKSLTADRGRMREMGAFNRVACRSRYRYSAVISELFRIYDSLARHAAAGERL